MHPSYLGNRVIDDNRNRNRYRTEQDDFGDTDFAKDAKFDRFVIKGNLESQYNAIKEIACRYHKKGYVDVKHLPYLMRDVDNYFGRKRNLGVKDVKEKLSKFALVKDRFIKVRDFIRQTLDEC